MITVDHVDFKFDLKLVLTTTTTGQIHFEIDKKNEFSECRMNQIKNEYKEFDLHKSTYRSTEESAFRVKHKLTAKLGETFETKYISKSTLTLRLVIKFQGRPQITDKNQSFELEILHIFSKSWSSIGIFKQSTQVSMAHLIGLEHLPGKY